MPRLPLGPRQEVQLAPVASHPGLQLRLASTSGYSAPHSVSSRLPFGLVRFVSRSLNHETPARRRRGFSQNSFMSVVKDRFSQSSVRLPNRTSPVGPRSRSDLSIRGFFMGCAPSRSSSAKRAKASRNPTCLTLHNIASTPHPPCIRGPRRLCFAPSNGKAPGKQLLLRGRSVDPL